MDSAGRLVELRARYARCASPALAHTQWDEEYIRNEMDLEKFRADGAYVWQSRDGNLAEAYETTFHHVQTIDRSMLLERMGEDEAFGVELVRLKSGRLVSRDLLDSIVEIYALDRVWNILSMDSLQVVDIGAGYGRFAHRLVQAHSGCRVFCVDAIAESTYLSERYIAYRAVAHRVHVVPFDEFESLMTRVKPDLAVNMHSFAECSLQAIAWWINKLALWGVPRLMIVPNRSDHGGLRLLSRESSSRIEYRPLLLRAGYRLKGAQPKYLDPLVMQRGVSPTHHHFYELAGGGTEGERVIPR